MRKAPELRFAGFDGGWEEKKFGKVIERRSKSLENNSLPRVEYEDIIPEIGKLNKDINTKSSIKKGIYFESNDVLFGKLRPYLKNYLNPQFDGIAVGDFWILNNKSGDNSFLFYYIQIPQFQYVANTSIGTKMPRSDWNLVSGSKFIYPSNNEQEKIGNLFRKLDDLIEIQEGKVAKMRDYKKSMLQKMFPKKGELVPEFRFDGFDGEWEENKLCKIGDTYTSLSGKTAEDFGHGEAHYVTYMNVYKNSIADINDLGNIEIDNKQGEVLNGDFFFTTSSETPEEVGLSSAWIYDKSNVYLNSFCFGFRPIINIDTSFFAYYFRSENFRRKVVMLAQGSTRFNISKKYMMDILVSYPSLPEQQKIGQFFKNLDTQIETEKKLLESYKMMKESLLQKMFV